VIPNGAPPTLGGVEPLEVATMDVRGLLTLVGFFVELRVEATSLFGALGEAGIVCECKIGGAVGSEG
jgi:hypothetical protein